MGSVAEYGFKKLHFFGLSWLSRCVRKNSPNNYFFDNIQLNFYRKACMRRLLLSLVLSLLASTTAHATSESLIKGVEVERLITVVKIPGEGDASDVTLESLLVKPSTPSPWPVVILPSNCSGAEDKLWHYWAPALSQAGIAVVLEDSFGARKITNACKNAFALPYKQRLLDVHVLLRQVRADPRFIPNKVALGGHSAGAITAFMSSFSEALRKMASENLEPFNLYFGAATGCELTFRDPTLNAPLLLIHGSRDEYTRLQPCVEAIDRLKLAGQPADILIIEGVEHSFSTNATFVRGLMKWPKEGPPLFMDEFSYVAKKSTALLHDGTPIGFEEYMRKHAGFLGKNLFGAYLGTTHDKAPEVVDGTLKFLKSNGF